MAKFLRIYKNTFILGSLLFSLLIFFSISSFCWAVMPVPSASQTISYGAVSAPVVNDDPVQAKAIGVGAVAGGGNTVSVAVQLSAFSGPVDIYFGLYAPSLDPVNIYIIREDGSFQTVAQGLAPWKTDVTGATSDKPFGDIPVSSLPSGQYTLYLLVTPSGGLNSYYLWETDFAISANNGGGNAVITGAGPGEIIAAVDESGQEFSVEAGSEGDFSLTVPAGHSYRIYIIEDGGVFPLVSDNSNIFNIASAGTLNLGIIALSAVAIPQNSPTVYAGVTAGGLNNTVPVSFITPETTGLSLSETVQKGLDVLKAGWLTKAKGYFKAAVTKGGGQNDKDTANFFYALTRVASIGTNTMSDGQADGLNDLGDILDAFGFGPFDGIRNYLGAPVAEPSVLPSNSPTGGDLQAFLNTVPRSEIAGAIQNLESVSKSFDRAWALPFDGKTAESDYGDVLTFRSSLKALLAFVMIENSYNLNADIDAVYNSDATIQTFLADNGSFLQLQSTAELAAARNLMSEAADDATSAINEIRGETDSQADDFVSLFDMTPSDINEMLTDIATFKASLYGPVNVDSEGTLNLSRFFAGLSFRTPNLLPQFIGNEVAGPYPDPTFGGIWIENASSSKSRSMKRVRSGVDVSPKDGIPDILQ